MEENQVRVNLGSKSDAPQANKFLKLLKEMGVRYGVSIGSCHWSAGEEFEDHVADFLEDVIVVIGGMSLAAPGIMAALDRNAGRTGRIIFAVPLDKAAQSAVEDLPPGTPVITCGYNRINVDASITNSALAVAMLIAREEKDPVIKTKLREWFKKMREKKRAVAEVDLDENGQIIIKK